MGIFTVHLEHVNFCNKITFVYNTHSHLEILTYCWSKRLSVKIFIAKNFSSFYDFGQITGKFLKKWSDVKSFVGNNFHHNNFNHLMKLDLFFLLTKFTSSYQSSTGTYIYALIILQLYYSMTEIYSITSTALNTDGYEGGRVSRI